MPKEVAQERFDQLLELVQASALDHALGLLETVQPVLIEGASKRDPRMLSGRTPTNKVVHAPLPVGGRTEDFEGRVMDVAIEHAQTWCLIGRLAGTDL